MTTKFEVIENHHEVSKLTKRLDALIRSAGAALLDRGVSETDVANILISSLSYQCTDFIVAMEEGEDNQRSTLKRFYEAMMFIYETNAAEHEVH